MCDNTSAINLTKKSIQHSRTKHIEIRHDFIKDHTNNSNTEIKFFEIANQLDDLSRKALTKGRFNFMTIELGILNYS